MTQSADNPSWLNLPAREDVDPSMQKLFGKAHEVLGFVPNVFVGFSIRPTHFSAWFNHFRLLMQGESELTQAEREMICLAVSAENGCLYCLVAHSADLRNLLGDAALVDYIGIDYRRAGLDERTTAMLDYAVKITNSSRSCSEADIEHLRGLGFSDVAIFDIVEVAAMFNLRIAWPARQVCCRMRSIMESADR